MNARISAGLSQRGLTLVELMIAMTLGLIVIGAIVAVFVATSRNARENDASAAVQDSARFALDVLGRDLAMAGYWGGVRTADAGLNIRLSSAATTAVSATAIPGDCGPSTVTAGSPFLFDVATPVVFHNHLDTSSSLINQFRCLGHAVTSSDVVLIRRVSGQASQDLTATFSDKAQLSPGRIYLKTNRNIGSIFQMPSSSNLSYSAPTDCPDGTGINAPCPPVGLPMQVYAYTPHLYYVRDYQKTVGDGVPTLCRRYLNDQISPPIMDEECLADGVETLQLEWGIEAGGGSTGVASYYTSAPSSAELEQARTVRIHVLVRALADPGAGSDGKIYKMADYSSSDAASNFVSRGFIRRLFSTTVVLKNFRQ